MRNRLVATAALCGVVGFAACVTTTGSDEVPAELPGKSDAERADAGQVGGIDDTATLASSRGVARMPVEVLEASIKVVAGADVKGQPIQWSVNNAPALDHDVYGAVLGRPDYVTVTAENPTPSSLYVKFIRDMSRRVCSDIATSDAQRGTYGDTTLWRFAPVDGSASEEQIDENMRYLTLRFLGMRLATGDDYLKQLRTVFDAGRAGSPKAGWFEGKPDAEGWRSVCIALYESPAFHID